MRHQDREHSGIRQAPNADCDHRDGDERRLGDRHGVQADEHDGEHDGCDHDTRETEVSDAVGPQVRRSR